MNTKKPFSFLISTMLAGAIGLALTTGSQAANHREAPLTALDHKADITDFFAFVSYDNAEKVTLLLNVDPLLEPGNGPNYFPFDPEIVYAIRIDNDKDAVEDVVVEVRFRTEIRLPGVFTGFVGAGAGINAPASSPAPVPPGTPIVPPAITALDGPGSQGLSLRQNYTVTFKQRQHGHLKTIFTKTHDRNGRRLFAVPSNVGPRTMPDYDTLARQGIYDLHSGIRVFAGTVDDPFWIDLGAFFDSANFRPSAFPTGVPGVLTDAQDGNDTDNFAPDDVSGYNVNTVAVEIPIRLLTRGGRIYDASHKDAVIGAWGTTSRPKTKVYSHKPGGKANLSQELVQIQRMGNPLINELIIGTGDKDKFSMSPPKQDAQFANYALDPVLARVLNAIYNLPVPTPPRTDLLPLVQYTAPICPGCTSNKSKGPVADLLRLNTGIPPTPLANQSRLGFLTLLDADPSNDDPAGFPNGRRVSDDVTDIAARAVAGVLAPGFGGFPYNRIGDGVNANDLPYQDTFPYVAFASSGRNGRHVDPTESGCTGAPGGICPTD